ncbi:MULTISPECIES: queuosine precursor transporter [Pseudomonas]|uniref:queuosine precursor transporter n=1 Tax=Pseudomonas TaxID=286 RepID=UPI001BE71CCA|nr:MULTISPECIES: queuosine precursor transporter [Pseudomonas]MBT2338221.1 queuosine precursor transporter [Pseudomonas fluorescens]MCD4528329.1 queuosine precursor transporter [Pseudomonas sp. C3-2018]
MASNAGTEIFKYKLLGYENGKSLAVIMVIATGRVIKIRLDELLKSKLIDDLSKAEIKDIYRKFYSGGTTVTAYEVKDRHERSWLTYVALNLVLFALYIFTNVSAAKLVYIERFDVVVTPGVFLYPLTFLVVDVLNESYGLRLARKAIFFAFVSNTFILILLSITGWLPGLPGWKLEGAYGEVIAHVSSALAASSLSFLVSEYVNSYLLCKIKNLTSSRFLFLRVFFSTFFAVILDSFIFCFIAFYGAMKNEDILGIVYVQIVIKMGFAFFNVLPAYGARALFRRYVVGTQAA